MAGPMKSRLCSGSQTSGFCKIRSDPAARWNRSATVFRKRTALACLQVLPPTIDPQPPMVVPRPVAPPISRIADLGKNMDVNEMYRPFMNQWDLGFSFNHQEQPQGYGLELLEGSLPVELEGTYYRNGPGRFSMGTDAYQHPYDGDGLIAAISIKGGKAHFRSAFIRTEEYKLETKAQKVLFRGTFATQRSGGVINNAMNLVIKNTSNTNVVPWGDSLLTLFEAGLPMNLDPATLATRGMETLGGVLTPGLPMELGSPDINAGFGKFQQLLGSNAELSESMIAGGGQACTAHPHRDSNTGRLALFTYKMQQEAGSLSPLAMDTMITFRELSPGTLDIFSTATFLMPGYGFVHDFALTTNYYIVFQPPVYTDMIPYITGQTCAASCVRFKAGSPTLVHVIPRPGSDAEKKGEVPRKFTISPATFTFHHCNAFEDESRPGQIHIDSIHYVSLPAIGKQASKEQQVDPDAGFKSKLKRTTIDLKQGTATVMPASMDLYLELPCINDVHYGQKHRYVYGYSSVFEAAAIGIAKVDMETQQSQRYEPGWGVMCLEPEFVPRPNARSEDDGWLLCTVFDSNTCTSEFWIFDAWQLPSGPIARIALPDALPHQLHGNWSSVYHGPEL